MAVAEFGAGFKPMGRKDYYRYYCPKVKADLVEEMKKYEEVLDPEYWGHRDLFEEDRVVTINLLQVLFLSLNV